MRGWGEVPSRVLLGLELPPLKLGTRDTEQLCLGRHNSSNETHFSSGHPAQATPRQWGEWAKGEQPGEGEGGSGGQGGPGEVKSLVTLAGTVPAERWPQLGLNKGEKICIDDSLQK